MDNQDTLDNSDLGAAADFDNSTIDANGVLFPGGTYGFVHGQYGMVCLKDWNISVCI